MASSNSWVCAGGDDNEEVIILDGKQMLYNLVTYSIMIIVYQKQINEKKRIEY
jgi:hypothetical protein